MTKYLFFTNSNYFLFYGEELNNWKDENNNTPHFVDIIAILDSVKSEFEEYSLSTSLNKKICILRCALHPVSFPQDGLIFLSAKGKDWNKYAYQFAHELYHTVLVNGFCNKVKWFEEVLAELASFFFLKRMSEKWKTRTLSDGFPGCSQLFAVQLFVEIQNIHKLDETQTFKDFIKTSQPQLEINPYMRAINALCASKMLPIFEKYPQLWKETLKITSLSDTNSFYDMLKQWLTIADDTNAVKQIVNLFD